mmetsp:Transcript_125506/g.349333  ORF Transcript_125506/g.349333 Transcript_125506/m.349333 type:complete len:257 (+) Transcript_125506:368-1138(+)
MSTLQLRWMQITAVALVALKEHVLVVAASPRAGLGAVAACRRLRGRVPERPRAMPIATHPGSRDQELRHGVGVTPRAAERAAPGGRSGGGAHSGAELLGRSTRAAEGLGKSFVQVDDRFRFVRVQQARDHALFGLLAHFPGSLQPTLARDPVEPGISHPGPSPALRRLLALGAAELCGWHVVHFAAPAALDHVVHVCLEMAAVGTQQLHLHGRQAPGRVGLGGDTLFRDRVGVAQPEHAEVHLATALVVAHLELKE